ncbi:hypothetical protein M0812_12390 [Anaeramoeba flamelloides]|uniref:Uncharacterized protein n=1 Tax=Anaeramoeba flamelloides TaxID=1746091 RepID=A0AAV7ZQF8_9EUKA|nr:hypothetical protein M0812_12390 [Anaeramoeba flamelloides]
MITNKEKYIPIIKITKNLMEAIFKKFDVSYDDIIVNLIKNIIKKIDHLEENQTNMMKLVESQMKTNEQTKTNLKKTTIDFIFEENLKLEAYRSTTRMIVSKILILKAKDSFNQVRYPGRDEASRVAKKM